MAKKQKGSEVNLYDWVGLKLGLWKDCPPLPPGSLLARHRLLFRRDDATEERLRDYFYRARREYTKRGPLRAGLALVEVLHADGWKTRRDDTYERFGKWRWWDVSNWGELRELKVLCGDYALSIIWSTGRFPWNTEAA